MLHHDYSNVYELGFFERSDGIGHWRNGKMRYGDTVAALAYALGYTSFAQVRQIFNCSEYGKESDGDTRTAKEQVELLKTASGTIVGFEIREPKSVLDVGGGRGELACAFAYLGIKVQAIEPHLQAATWFAHTTAKMFGNTGIVKLSNKTCPECLEDLDLSDIDTVTFVESLEHIPVECFDLFWPPVKEALVKNKGMLIVTNWLDYHPLNVTGREHCRRTDDALYAHLAEGGKVVYQEGSHLVVQY